MEPVVSGGERESERGERAKINNQYWKEFLAKMSGKRRRRLWQLQMQTAANAARGQRMQQHWERERESARVRTEQECERASQRGEAAASYCRLFGVGASFTHSRLELLQFECVVSKRNERECSSYSLSPSLCVLVLGCCAWVRAWLYEWEPESVCAHTVVLVFLCVLSVFCFCACIFDICFFAFELFLGPKSSALCEIFSYD